MCGGLVAGWLCSTGPVVRYASGSRKLGLDGSGVVGIGKVVYNPQVVQGGGSTEL